MSSFNRYTNSKSYSGASESRFSDQPRREEARLENELVCVIVSGRIDLLKPDFGPVRDGEPIMLFDEENRYTPEYIFGNYLEGCR
ncbi:hypothetical protein YC2023_049794 [Brassica napus]